MNLDATPSWLQPHTGLSATDLQRVGAAVTAARAASTRKVYANLWRQWERWCYARDLDAFPADPMALCAYLAERAESGTNRPDSHCRLLRDRARAPGPRRP
jgi:hypothetical protein